MKEVDPVSQQNEQAPAVAANDLVPLLYTELRRLASARIAREQPGQTLQATALVHEAWLRLGSGVFANKAHFFAAASQAMRRILIERARRKMREKRGSGAAHADLDGIEVAMPQGNEEEALAVSEALDQLAVLHPQKAELVKLRYFVGLSFEEVAEIMGLSLTTAKRDWAFARSWLHRKIVAGK
jgi:RNA polymerase sigma factor (TIGR02999 family)